MLFHEPTYPIFLALLFVAFWVGARFSRFRTGLLVAASYAFYFYGTFESAQRAFESQEQKPPLGVMPWSVLCLGIVFVGSTLDFYVAHAIARAQSQARKRAWLLLSIGYYLGVLALFKYLDFFIGAFADLCRIAGFPIHPKTLGLILPFGISFFTFETMSYTIDVYRGDLAPHRRYGEYLLFVCFFPHLVAGPIVRPKSFLPQLAAEPRFDEYQHGEGVALIVRGLAKKLVIGDALAANLVDRVFESPERFSSLEVLLGVYGYAFQLYSDFSGYTDVARGSAKLFGYELPLNFDRPYLATSLQDFWRRWHISLSSWLRDYLYIPLGGNRGSFAKTQRNLFLTMLLGGLWHGANWTFVVWGAWHGGGLALGRFVDRIRGAETKAEAAKGLPARLLGRLVTFHLVCVGWVFFRAPSLRGAIATFRELADMRSGLDHLATSTLVILGGAAVLHVTPTSIRAGLERDFARSSMLMQGAMLFVAIVVIHLFASQKAAPFVYGQF
jgi:D-alanyl-lipoteichoic acid acyltransferase DltB (MBOAT superfamily)